VGAEQFALLDHGVSDPCCGFFGGRSTEDYRGKRYAHNHGY
jgi:hypothetical protein